MRNRVERGERELDHTAQEVLAKYVGWGGLSEVFDEEKGGQWESARKFLKENKFQKIDFLYNNSFEYENKILCGTRGWSLVDEEIDEKLINREKEEKDHE